MGVTPSLRPRCLSYGFIPTIAIWGVGGSGMGIAFHETCTLEHLQVFRDGVGIPAGRVHEHIHHEGETGIGGRPGHR